MGTFATNDHSLNVYYTQFPKNKNINGKDNIFKK